MGSPHWWLPLEGVPPRSGIAEEDGSDVCDLGQTEPEAKSCEHRNRGDALDPLAPRPESSRRGRVGTSIGPEPELVLRRRQHLHPHRPCRGLALGSGRAAGTAQAGRRGQTVINIIGARRSVMRTKERHSGQGVRMSPNFEAGEEVELSRDQEEEKEIVEQTPANSHCKILRQGRTPCVLGVPQGPAWLQESMQGRLEDAREGQAGGWAPRKERWPH